jgi:cell division protein FtsL
MRRRKKSRKTVLVRVGIFAYIALCMFGIVWIRASVIGLEYEIGKLNNLRADLVKERRMALATRANYFSSSRIEQTASRKLGMRMPDRADVFYVTTLNPAGLYRASGN